jgi:hypothetical protein
MLETYPDTIENLKQKGYKVTQFDSALFDTKSGSVLVFIYVANAEK